jgi:hypothetical protein
LSVKSFPNPFTGSATIEYKLPVPTYASLKVYDLTGRVIAVLVDQYLPEGTYHGTFEPSSGGLYVIVLSTTESVVTTKTIKIN